jgi:hypothetical protein
MSSSAAPAAIAHETDGERNILRIYFRGVVTAGELHARIDELCGAIGSMRNGFLLLTDLCELLEMEIDTVRDLTRIMDASLATGVKQIVRVIPDPRKDIGFHLLSMTHYRGRVPITICDTREEGERVLQSSTVQSAGVRR